MVTPNLIGFRCNLNHGYDGTIMLRARQKSYLGGAAATLLVAASSMGLVAGLSMAARAQNAGNAGFVTEFRGTNPSPVNNVFNERWDDGGSDFVLGGDGVVRSSHEAVSGISPLSEANQIGNITLGYAAPMAVPNITDMDHQEEQPGIRNGNAPAAEGAAAGVPECGPSPLSPDEIQNVVAETAQRHGVDAVFATAIAFAESNFDQHRNSNKGARGPMQLMPDTAERFGVTDVCDPIANIDGGVRYLRVLIDEFKNPILAAAAYNAGEGRIYEYGGIPPFQETVSYVAKVLNFQLGLPVPSRDARPATVVSSPTGNSAGGVIQERVPGQFVGGVMHF
jgi:hypothetical protein